MRKTATLHIMDKEEELRLLKDPMHQQENIRKYPKYTELFMVAS